MSPHPHPLPQPIRFGPLHRRFLHGCFALLWASGVTWLVLHYFFARQGPFGPTPHPLTPWTLRVHGLAGFASLIAIGSVLPVHARRAWNLRKNRFSGVAFKAMLLWLTLTAWALYYFVDADATPWLPSLHWIPGLALPLLLTTHILAGRRSIVQPARAPRTATPCPGTPAALKRSA